MLASERFVFRTENAYSGIFTLEQLRKREVMYSFYVREMGDSRDSVRRFRILLSFICIDQQFRFVPRVIVFL